MITIIDNELGNISSISNMLNKLGVKSIRVKDPSQADITDKIILPGVGSFDHGMRKMEDSGWKETLYKAVDEGAYVLGICLGMQLLFDKSEEGSLPGLGFISGDIVRFNFENENLKVPHMGWNIVNSDPASPLITNHNEEQRFYHVHSYHAVCNNKSNIIGYTHYGYDFTSIVQRDKIFGVQFHPEKSHRFGMALLTNFAKL